MRDKKKKVARNIAFVLICILAITVFNICRKTTHAENNQNFIDYSGNVDKIRILEIAPGNGYILGTNVNPPVEEPLTSGTTNVIVTHMSMPEYISMVDDIAGKYDVVVISNKLDSSNITPISYNPNLFWTNTYAYRPYTAPFTQKMDITTEYFPENDITNKRAQNIIDMINNGQNVYIDSSITGDARLNTTKLQSIFTGNGIGSGITTKSNFQVLSSAQITLDKIVNDVNVTNIEAKRPKIKSILEPVDETDVANPKRNLNFTVNADTGSDKNVTVNLYLDFNADGLFSSKEKVKSVQYTGQNGYKDYSISYLLYNSFVGYLDWKIEIVRPNGVKSEQIENVKMRSLKGKKIIKVLQINPDSDTAFYYDNGNKYGQTKLTSNATFLNMCQSLDDYDIQIDNITAANFQSQYGASSAKKHLKSDCMAGSSHTGGYDMVIVGFGDNYRWVDFTIDDALTDLDNFIAANKSVMFTHDTMQNESQGTKHFTSHYRDYVGQARYATSTAVSVQNLYTDVDESGNLVNTTIPHDIKSIKGYSAFNKDNAPSNGLWKSTQTNMIRNVNNAQITQYPYNLSNLGNTINDCGVSRTKGVVKVALTHIQWYQLNLEDPDVVPWYNLIHTTMNSGDSRNFYYTYSKKNITYSGTGHSGVGTEVQEFQLFINTIIKAERGSNSVPELSNYVEDRTNGTVTPSGTTTPALATTLPASTTVLGTTITPAGTATPTVTLTGSTTEIGTTTPVTPVENNATISNIESCKDFEYLTIPMDQDNDKLDVTVTLNYDNAKYNYTESKYNDSATKTIYAGTVLNSDQGIRMKIPKTYYDKMKKGEGFAITTKVCDPLSNADAKTYNTKTFNVTVNGNNPPKVENKKIDDTTITEMQEIPVYKFQDFAFKTIPSDVDIGDKLKLSVTIDGRSISTMKLNGDNINGDTLLNSGDLVNVTIPKEELSSLNLGDLATIVSTAEDPKGIKTSKTFKVVIANSPPSISNQKLITAEDIPSIEGDVLAKENALSQDKFSEFAFRAIPSDLDTNEDLKVKATAEMEDGTPLVVNMELDGVAIDSDTLLKTDSSKILKVKMPASSFKNLNPEDYVKITVTVTDYYGVKTSKRFYLEINFIAPIIKHGMVTNTIGDDVEVDTIGNNKVKNYAIVDFAGKLTTIYDPSSTIKLKLDTGLNIVENKPVVIYRLINGVKYGNWSMLKNSDGDYAITFNKDDILSYGSIEPEGMTFIVKYTAEIMDAPKLQQEQYTNGLYAYIHQRKTSSIKEYFENTTIYTEKKVIPPLRLF